jgi:hypothetical protein
MPTDLYAPKTTGVFNVEVHPLKSGTVSQRWEYDEKTKTIAPELYPGKALSEGANKNLFIFRQLHLAMQQFLIDTTNGIVTNVLSKNLSTVSSKKTTVGWNSVMEAERKIPSMQQHWVILECKELPTIEEPEESAGSKAQAMMEDDINTVK